MGGASAIFAFVLSSKSTSAFRGLRWGGPALAYAKILRRRVVPAAATAVGVRVPALRLCSPTSSAEDEEGDVLERGLAVGLKRALFRSVKIAKMLMLRAVCLQW